MFVRRVLYSRTGQHACVGSQSLRSSFCAGRAGEECKVADGRELWLLAEMYEVDGVREWLLTEGVDKESVFGAYEFGLVPEGYRQDLRESCLLQARRGLGGMCDAHFREVGIGTVSALLEVMVAKERGNKRNGKAALAAVKLLERW